MPSKGHSKRSPDELPMSPAGPGNQTGDVIEFDPDAPYGGSGEGLEVLEPTTAVDTIPFNQDWSAAQEELEQRLGGSEIYIASLSEEVSDYSMSAERVIGTGIGFRAVSGSLTPDVVLKVYVTEKTATGRLHSFDAVPSSVAGIPVDVEEIGEIVPQMYNRRYARPVRCGVSIGHPDVTAGTLGCLVVLNNNRLCLLSNNHVISNSNNARIGDPIIQPGRIDSGVTPGDRIAILENFIPISFPGPNFVDAAVAWTAFRYVDPRHVAYTLNPTPLTAQLGMTVKKNGRTTQATLGTVTDLSVNISIGFPGGVAQFRNQIGIRGVGGTFSQGGDSGSLIVTGNTNQPVGLLFAGRTDNTITFANPIASVIQTLGIRNFVNQQ